MSDLIQQRRGLKERALDEVKKAVLITLYLWVLLAVFAMHRSIILKQHNINALVLAKVILIAGGLHVGHHFTECPLAYSVFLKPFLHSCSSSFTSLKMSPQVYWMGRRPCKALSKLAAAACAVSYG